MDKIGRLRALEKLDEAFEAEIRRVSTVQYNSNEICRHFFGQLRAKYEALIAELGQEVGAVTNEMVLAAADAFLMHPGCVDQTVGHGPIRAALEAAFTSPAHTSEARDCPAQFFASGPDGWFFTDRAEYAELVIRNCGYDRDDWTITDLYAAMRQEAE